MPILITRSHPPTQCLPLCTLITRSLSYTQHLFKTPSTKYTNITRSLSYNTQDSFKTPSTQYTNINRSLSYTQDSYTGGGDVRILENSPRKWPNSHSQKFSKTLIPPPPPLRNGKIVYQDILRLPVPLNTLHNVHLNAKSHNLR